MNQPGWWPKNALVGSLCLTGVIAVGLVAAAAVVAFVYFNVPRSVRSWFPVASLTLNGWLLWRVRRQSRRGRHRPSGSSRSGTSSR